MGIGFLGPTKKYIGGGGREMVLGSILDILEELHLGRLGMLLDHKREKNSNRQCFCKEQCFHQ